MPADIPVVIGFQVTTLMFDSPRVVRAVDRATYRAMLRTGQYVRAVARRSIRPKRGTSRAGHAPHDKTGLLRAFILYGFDPVSRSVVVGPRKLSGVESYPGMTVPEVLEYGGTVPMDITQAKLIELRENDAWHLWQRYRDEEGQTVRARYRPHPYMGPALERSLPKIDDFWADSVR